LAVHAGSVRLVFAMARDNHLPFARALAHVPERTRAPIVPVVIIGALAAFILILNINLPHCGGMLCSVPIAWANLAYLLVTLPMLVGRLRGRCRPQPLPREPVLEAGGLPQLGTTRRLFSMGGFGLPINAIAVAWGFFVVINVSWPRPEVYGSDLW